MTGYTDIVVLKPLKTRCENCPSPTFHRVTRSRIYACKLCLTYSEKQRIKTIGRAYR